MLTVHIFSKDDSTMVLPVGEMAYGACSELKDIISGHMGPGVILSFNMEKVSFVDSVGVGFLVQMKNLSEKRNGTFEMHRLQKNVKLVIDRLTLNEFLNASTDVISDHIHDMPARPLTRSIACLTGGS